MIATAKSPEARRGSRWLLHGGSASGAWAALAALLVPKCPLCIAALLTVVGMNAALASVIARLIRPLAFCLPVAVTLALLAVRFLFRGPRSSTAALRHQARHQQAAPAPHHCCK